MHTIFISLHTLEGRTTTVVGRGIVWIELQDGRVVLQLELSLLEHAVREGAILECIDERRVDAYGLGEVLYGTLVQVETRVAVAATVVRDRVVWVDAKRLVDLGDGATVLAECAPRDGLVADGLVVQRAQHDGLVEARNHLVMTLEAAIRVRAIVVHECVERVEARGVVVLANAVHVIELPSIDRGLGRESIGLCDLGGSRSRSTNDDPSFVT